MRESDIVIDMQKTGKKIMSISKKLGYTVKDLQMYLGFSCPQSIYRWFKGIIMPSIDNLYKLSVLFGVHMDDMIVIEGKEKDSKISIDIILCNRKSVDRLLAYGRLGVA